VTGTARQRRFAQVKKRAEGDRQRQSGHHKDGPGQRQFNKG
jgi:hypothetical protein